LIHLLVFERHSLNSGISNNDWYEFYENVHGYGPEAFSSFKSVQSRPPWIARTQRIEALLEVLQKFQKMSQRLRKFEPHCSGNIAFEKTEKKSVPKTKVA
jgi:hypothetical protein